MATTLSTSKLGQIRGKSGDGVTQYLGIKYATLENRFADAQLIEERQGDVLDATVDGPTALSLPIGCDIELGHVQHSILKKELPQSDVDCLNLNIAVPSDATPSSNLPVLFFIHGGGLFIGANSWPQYDLTRLAKLSAEKGLPMVIVAINYRLGAPGFLTSKELRDAGYNSNNGLRDQRVALEWVHKHIRDFGGDPENITTGGMSAGAASVTYHLHSQTPLFNRAIVMSGSSLLIQPLPYEIHEQNYQKAMAALGLADASPEDRVKALLELPGQELITKLPPSVRYVPALDSDLVVPGVTHAEVGNLESKVLPGKDWCKELLIGDAEVDASIFEYLSPQMRNNCAKRFIAVLKETVGSHPEIAQRILDAYQISENTPDDAAILSILTFFTDISFHSSTLSFARGWNGSAYVYYFNEGNPWDGPWKGRANHILDVIYFFQNLGESLNPEQKEVGEAFAEDFFKFCHGIAPWPAITPGTIDTGFSARIYGPSQKGNITNVVQQAFGGETLRRSVLYECSSVVALDDLAKVFVAFQSS
ncbi:uncharacterized protein N7496_007494 [Penicillium cataractarum]|uniref:Carboxylesterase type B domain-containing protein n=1 Tax=Penicillium cataractarum TaxID=2100454 RepID=A0A9W9S4A5_9EURO|nr:uncharacterized protein N7496_007494 [Penicillium cataractarum]KAJ5371402.1 hypothetical protein N7496_007494 [Penicillium cataractarum]